MRLVWSRHALQQLHELQFRGDAAWRRAVAERILDAADRLIDFPQIGRATGDPGVRLVLVARTGFAIRYLVRDDRIEIADIIGGGGA